MDVATYLPMMLRQQALSSVDYHMCNLLAAVSASTEIAHIPLPGSFICLNVVWVLFDNDHALQDTGEGQILVRGKLRPVAHAQQHWRRVRLKPRDRLGPARLHDIDGRQLKPANTFLLQISRPSTSITIAPGKSSHARPAVYVSASKVNFLPPTHVRSLQACQISRINCCHG